MRTEDLIGVLAADLAPVDRPRLQRRFLGHAAAGLALAVAGMLLLLGPRADLAAAAALPMFWAKLAFPAAIGGGALLLLRRLGTPGMGAGWGPAAVGFPVLVIWVMAAAVLLATPPPSRLALVLGSTWRVCPAWITLLSLPAFVLALRSMRELAPTRLRLAGACAGLLAGATAALAYSVHCPELEAPFLAVWYLLGMLVPAAFGAMLGPRLLRW